MYIKNQFRILRKVLALIYFVIQIFGLWPYTVVDNTTRHIKYNFFKFVYSIVFPFIVVYSFYTFGIAMLQSQESAALVLSKTMKSATALSSIIIAISYLSIYIGQHITFSKTKSFYCKCTETWNCWNRFLMKMSILERFCLFFHQDNWFRYL